MKNMVFRYAPAVALIAVASGILSFAADQKAGNDSVVTSMPLTFKPGIEIPEAVSRSGNLILQVEGKIDQERAIRCELRVFNSMLAAGAAAGADSLRRLDPQALGEGVMYSVSDSPAVSHKLRLEANSLAIASTKSVIRASTELPNHARASLVLECEKDGAEEIKRDDIKKVIPQIDFPVL